MSIEDSAKKYILNTYSRFPLTFLRGDAVWLYSDKDEKYLDMTSGIAVSCLGYNHPAMVKAIKEQADKLLHTSNLFYTEPCTVLAERLVKSSIFDKVFFCNSGAEANEAAIKLCRKYGRTKGGDNKYRIITMKDSFHGRTMGTISATGQEKFRKSFLPALEGFEHVKLNDLAEIELAMDESVAAVMIEPVLGEAGILPAEQSYLELLRKLCDKYDSLLVFDEVQTGVGRTGKLFAYEHFLPVKPDLITLAKGLGGGLPIGALMVSERLKDVLVPGDHASTFGGNPLSSAAANAVLESFEKENILQNVNEMSSYFVGELEKLKKKYPAIVTIIRGKGLLIGIQTDYENRVLIGELIEHKILSVPAGNNITRFVPPLTVKKEHIDLVIKALDSIFSNKEK